MSDDYVKGSPQQQKPSGKKKLDRKSFFVKTEKKSYLSSSWQFLQRGSFRETLKWG